MTPFEGRLMMQANSDNQRWLVYEENGRAIAERYYGQVLPPGAIVVTAPAEKLAIGMFQG